jgi:hypothetical protein
MRRLAFNGICGAPSGWSPSASLRVPTCRCHSVDWSDLGHWSVPIEVSGFPIECFLVPDATARLFVFDVSSPSSTVVAHGYSLCVTDARDAVCTLFVDDALGPATSDAVSFVVTLCDLFFFL